ncbi:hypothetical protein KEM54_002300 [Ascosphaera aggregata]|nr:hypothetical protein KEM54_002300 [Ascosphaera aggregata]
MPKTLLSLPFELLGTICTFLEDEYKPGLLAFSQVSRHCYEAANKLRWKKLYIRLAHSQHLVSEVNGWMDILQNTNAWPYVRQLELDEPCVGLLENPDGLAALVDFLPRLFKLEDLIYACKDPFPPALLQVLHECLPRCKLHLMSFDLETLPTPNSTNARFSTLVGPQHDVPTVLTNEEDTTAHNSNAGVTTPTGPSTNLIDEHKLALATSPSLHTIVIQSAMLRALTVNEDVALHMAAGLAPNLKLVNILTWYYDRAPKRLSQVTEESANQKMLESLFKDREPGSLEGLSLPPVGLDQFMEWEKKVDFRKLRTLRLWSASPEMLERASQCSFSSLKTFGVSFDSKGEEFDSPGRRLIMSLPALENLYLGYYAEGLLDTALITHGRSLCKLYMQGAVKADEVSRMGLQCPKLSDLTILLQCNGNDTCEGFSRVLGTLRHLRTLNLTADIYRGTGPTDEKWARDLFKSIANHNKTLQKAQIRPFANNIRYDCFKFSAMTKEEDDRIVVHKADVWRSSDRFFKTMFY